MTEERQTQDQPENVGYAAPTLMVHGKMDLLTAQGTKPGRENQGNTRGRRP